MRIAVASLFAVMLLALCAGAGEHFLCANFETGCCATKRGPHGVRVIVYLRPGDIISTGTAESWMLCGPGWMKMDRKGVPREVPWPWPHWPGLSVDPRLRLHAAAIRASVAR